MLDLQNILKNSIRPVLQILAPGILLWLVFYLSSVGWLPSFQKADTLTISLAAMQVTLAALAIFIGIAAIVGFQTLQHAAKVHAEEVAEDTAIKEVQSYLSTYLPKEKLDEIKHSLKNNAKERPDNETRERRKADGGGDTVPD